MTDRDPGGDDAASRGKAPAPLNPVLAKRRARQPTRQEAKYDLAARPVRSVPSRRDYAAPPYDPTRNATANGTNRSYSYTTAQDAWLAARRDG